MSKIIATHGLVVSSWQGRTTCAQVRLVVETDEGEFRVIDPMGLYAAGKPPPSDPNAIVPDDFLGLDVTSGTAMASVDEARAYAQVIADNVQRARIFEQHVAPDVSPV